MIEKTLGFLEDALNAYLSARFPGTQPHAMVGSLSNTDGTPAARTDSRLVISLVNIERETAAAAGGTAPRPGGGYARQQPPLYLNLYVLFSASFNNNYQQALQFLDAALGFFQAQPNFDAHSSADFPRDLEKLSLELVSLSIQELNNLWAILGAKYLPSALYKVRMLAVQEHWMTAAVSGIVAPGVSVGR